MAVFQWFVRCTPGLTLLALLIFLECTLGIVRSQLRGLLHPKDAIPFVGNSILLWLFVSYSLVLHCMSWIFPLRLCWSAWIAGSRVEEAHRIAEDEQTMVNTPLDEVSMKSFDLPVIEEVISERMQAVMAIIVPSYKENISTLEDTLDVLASHPLARETYHVYLAMEGRDPDALQTAQQLIRTFRTRFMDMRYTMHPVIDGEAPGKSSNVSWAAKEVERTYSGRPEWRNVLITTMDSDTHLLPQYFSHLQTRHYENRSAGHLTDMTLYMPPIVFDRNAHCVPMLVRVADLMWCGAGLSCFLPKPTASGIGIPTAVYTIPLALAHLVNGWDTGPGAIGEDMHMMLKCYFATNGRLRIESVPSPASQCNISVETRGVRGWILNHNARYSQGLRHMWGCLDTGFALTQWLALRKKSSPGNDPTLAYCKDNSPQRRRKLSHTELSLKLSQYALHGSEARRFTFRNFILFTRLFEAHFLPIHLFLILLASALFTPVLRRTTDVFWLKFCLDVTGYIRAGSYITMLMYFFVFYERYHRICVQAREREMLKAGLHEQLAGQFSRRGRTSIRYWPDYFVFPIAGTLFGSFCLFQAAISHFWTDRLVYLVSAKPVRSVVSGDQVREAKERS